MKVLPPARLHACHQLSIHKHPLNLPARPHFLPLPPENHPSSPHDDHDQAKAAADAAQNEGIDVYLTMISGVVNAGKKLPFDNGALQFFFGPPTVIEGDKGSRDASVRGAVKKGDPTGDYTIVFKA